MFFDELPWMVTPRSHLMQTLDEYWNDKWVNNSKIKLVVCGSAAGWMLENLINAKGGLHNRLTSIMQLEPLNLAKTKCFLQHKKVRLNNQQITMLSLVMGGVMYYLDSVERDLSVAENIDKLCFTRQSLLFKEFPILYKSLFDHSEVHQEIIRVIAAHRYGIVQEEIIRKTKNLSSGGTAVKRLNELEAAGFVVSFIPYGKKEKGKFYRVIDEYTLFYLKWIEPITKTPRKLVKAKNYWQGKMQSPSWRSWSGYAFEALCYKHIPQIMDALNIPSSADIGAWQYSSSPKSDSQGAQIDLLFDRDDGVITICEIKYSEQPFKIDKAYYHQLVNKIEIFKKQTQTKKQITVAFITKNGLKETIYSEELCPKVVTLADLFKEC